MNKYSNWIIRAGLAEASEMYGLTLDEINEIEKARCVSLPSDYKNFLRQCGRSAGHFGKDIDILFPRFLNLNIEFQEISEEFDISYKPPKNAFFFTAYQGGWFHSFSAKTKTQIFMF